MTISQLSVGNLPKGKVGQLYGNTRLYHEESFDSNENRAAEVWTVVVTDEGAGAALNNTEYYFDIFGERISFTSDASATTTEVAAGLLAAAEANIVAAGVATYGASTGTLTVTARHDGIDLEIESDMASLTLTETTAADAGDVMPFGRAVVDDGAGGVRLYEDSTDAPADIVGITRYTYDEAATTVGSSSLDGVPVGRQNIVLKTGRLYVEGAEAAAAAKGDNIYVGGDAGEFGMFFTTAGTGREQITDGTIKWHGPGVVEINRGF